MMIVVLAYVADQTVVKRSLAAMNRMTRSIRTDIANLVRRSTFHVDTGSGGFMLKDAATGG